MRKLFVCSMLLVCACASRPSSDFQSGDAESAIRKAESGFMTAVRGGDVDAMTNLYASNAVLLPPNAPAMPNHDAIHAFWGGMMATASAVDLTLTTSDVQQSGDLAVETGQYVLHLTPKNATTPVNDQGKYLVAWRKVGGQWKMIRDAFSSDLPAPH
jgi:ketosteroid isomerase-like protein